MSIESEIRDVVEDSLFDIRLALDWLLVDRKNRFMDSLTPLKCSRCSKLVGQDVLHTVDVSISQKSFIFNLSVNHRELGGVCTSYSHSDPDAALKQLRTILKGE